MASRYQLKDGTVYSGDNIPFGGDTGKALSYIKNYRVTVRTSVAMVPYARLRISPSYENLAPERRRHSLVMRARTR